MTKKKQISIFPLILAVILLIIPVQFTLADPFQIAQTSPDPTEKSQLEQQLQAIQQEIAQYEQQLGQVQSEKNTLNNKIKQLQLQKNKIAAQIKETNLNIRNIGEQIGATQDQIAVRQEHIVSLRDQIGNLIPAIYEKDQTSSVEILLANDGLIGFYTELDAYEQINKNLKKYLDEVEEESLALKQEQDQLTEQQDSQKAYLSIQSLQNAQLASNIGNQNDLLVQTKGVEANYQATLSDKKKQAAAIQNRLYELFGVGPGQQVTFGQAVEIAKGVSNMTGVRAAFLLAILTQESSLGKNVGTCNRPNDPPSKSYKVVMKPDRDIPPFLQITSDLGLDPETTPVSCPMTSRGKQVGWGGAMGPAQFIPSTWMGYKDKVAALTGKMANPWDIRDAFVAAAIKLKNDGAGTVSGEWAAAMRYFSGGTNVRFRFYGDNVVATANRYQADIDELNAN
jgi:peptidoglycan hydrolase CwlO-like protein